MGFSFKNIRTFYGLLSIILVSNLFIAFNLLFFSASYTSTSTTGNIITTMVDTNSTTELNATHCLHHISKYSPRECNLYAFGWDGHVFESSHLIVLIAAKSGSTFFKWTMLHNLQKRIPAKYTKVISPVLNYNYNNNQSMQTHNNFSDKCRNFVATYYCDASYKKIFVYRDPLTRLLSGYLEKCTESQHPFKPKLNSHIHCKNYLLSVKKENNTLQAFVKWLLNDYDEYNDTIKLKIDLHFRNFYLFADLKHFINNYKEWHMMSMHDANTWDYITKSILMYDKLFPYWYTIKNKWFPNATHTKQKDPHDTNSSAKTLFYYDDIETLQFGLRYTWKDYFIFEWNLPEWICIVLQSHNNSAFVVSDFIKHAFTDKPQLWPSCVV